MEYEKRACVFMVQLLLAVGGDVVSSHVCRSILTLCICLAVLGVFMAIETLLSPIEIEKEAQNDMPYVGEHVCHC